MPSLTAPALTRATHPLSPSLGPNAESHLGSAAVRSSRSPASSDRCTDSILGIDLPHPAQAPGNSAGGRKGSGAWRKPENQVQNSNREKNQPPRAALEPREVESSSGSSLGKAPCQPHHSIGSGRCSWSGKSGQGAAQKERPESPWKAVVWPARQDWASFHYI